MKSVFRLSVGLLLAASVVGCNTCQQSCNTFRPSCNPCQQSCNPCQKCCLHKLFSKLRGGGCCQETQCGDGCGNSLAYPGDDWQGNPQAMVGQMPMTAGRSCCGTAPQVATMSVPSGGCSSCCGNVAAQSAPGGCTSCGSSVQNAPKTPPYGGGNGGCTSCAAGTTQDAFYSPIDSHHLSPAPAPPAESNSGAPNETPSGDKSASQVESIQKINWVPRQL